MTKWLLLAVALIAGLGALTLSSQSSAALPVGAKAPDFHTKGALDGKVVDVDLGRMLKKGPVVLYFYPKAFTSGCTLEARAFSQAMPEFKKAGAQVVGLSADGLDTLKEFSVKECSGAFPVAVADAKLIKAYDAAMPGVSAVKTMSGRVSFVIGRGGRIKMVHDAMDWKDHVGKSLAAVKALKA
jgi:peroxiredoxin Q/BCP